MNQNFYKAFFMVVIGALAVYGGLNLTTQIRLAENLRPTIPKIESDDVLSEPPPEIRRR